MRIFSSRCFRNHLPKQYLNGLCPPVNISIRSILSPSNNRILNNLYRPHNKLLPRTMSSSAPTFTHIWADPEVAERYKTAENASRPFCKIMVEKSGLIESTSKANVFDLATGTGALVKELYDAVPKEKWGNLRVLGGDISESMLESLKKRGESEGWTGLETQVTDGNVSSNESSSRF